MLLSLDLINNYLIRLVNNSINNLNNLNMKDQIKVLVFFYGSLMKCFWNYDNLKIET